MLVSLIHFLWFLWFCTGRFRALRCCLPRLQSHILCFPALRCCCYCLPHTPTLTYVLSFTIALYNAHMWSFMPRAAVGMCTHRHKTCFALLFILRRAFHWYYWRTLGWRRRLCHVLMVGSVTLHISLFCCGSSNLDERHAAVPTTLPRLPYIRSITAAFSIALPQRCACIFLLFCRQKGWRLPFSRDFFAILLRLFSRTVGFNSPGLYTYLVRLATTYESSLHSPYTQQQTFVLFLDNVPIKL